MSKNKNKQKKDKQKKKKSGLKPKKSMRLSKLKGTASDPRSRSSRLRSF